MCWDRAPTNGVIVAPFGSLQPSVDYGRQPMAPRNPQFSLYLPRTVLAWQAAEHGERVRRVDGTMVFADISGFTPMVERASAEGREGAERVSGVLNSLFEEILAVVVDEGGDILMFGGDASLIWFEGTDHVERAARASLDMQEAIEDVGIDGVGISVGLETGEIAMVLGGVGHRELLTFGPAVDGALAAEKVAGTGEVRVGVEAAAVLPADTLELDASGAPALLVDVADPTGVAPAMLVPNADHLDLADFIPEALRGALRVAGSFAEHRPAAVGFIHLDAGSVALDDLDVDEIVRLTGVIEAESNRHDVAVLGSDCEIGGVKFLLAAGAPKATLHDEERMLRTLRAVQDAAIGSTIRVRSGATRGHVLAGDFGASGRRYYTILGDAVNLAARLMSKAEPGQLITIDPVLERSPTAFAIDRLPPVTLKGKSKPVAPIAVGPVVGVERVDWARFLPLVGRQAELSLLIERLGELRDGRGGVIEIVGGSGIGKSRLVGEVLDRAVALDSYVLICEQYERDTPYFIGGHLLRGILALKPDSDIHEVEARVDEVIAVEPGLAPFRPLLGVPLGLDLGTTKEVDDLGTEFRTEKMHETVAAFLAAAHPQPMLVAAEDTQWMDEASRALLDHLGRLVGDRSWLFVSTSDRPRVEVSEHHRLLEIERLGADDMRTMLRRAAREHPVSDATIESIIDVADGHPFFAVELVRHGEVGGLPQSVEAVFAQRIDRLDGRDRQLLRYVSVLGNSFAFDLLGEALPQIAPSSEDTDTWERLDAFLDVTVFGNVQFRQDLVRQVAYEGLTVERRKEIHGIVGDALRRRSRRRARRQAPLLSTHFHLADRWEESWEYSRIAAEAADAANAVIEALGLYERAVEAGRRIDAAPIEIAAVAEAAAQVSIRMGALDRGDTMLGVALDLGEPGGVDQARRHRIGATIRRERGMLAEASESLAAGLAVLEGDEDPAARIEWVECLVGRAGVLHRQGDHEASLAAALEAIDAAEKTGHKPGLGAASSIALLDHVHVGRVSERDHGAEALAVFEELDDPHGGAKVMNNIATRHYFAGDWQSAADDWRAAADLYERAGDAIGMATTVNNLGEVLADQGHLEQAVELFEEARRAWRAASFGIGVALATQNLGRTAARAGEPELARELLDDAMEQFAANGQRAYELDTELRIAEVAAYAGRRHQIDLGDLGDDLPSTLAPLRDRLAAWAAADADALRAAAADTPPYERAMCLDLVARMTGDDEAAAEASAIFDELDAVGAARYALP